MNAAPAAIIFDFDGTLADTAPDMTAALNDWLAARARPSVCAASARRVCSGGSRALLALCGVAEEDMEAAVPDYLQRYERTDYQRTKLFAGVSEMLAALNADGLPWGVATNKPARYFSPIARRLLEPLRPAALVARDDAMPPKPHPAMLLAAAQQCGVPPQRCLYVGDDERDAAAAQNANMPFIGVTWGYWRSEQWEQQQENHAPPAIAALISTPAALLPAAALAASPHT